MLDSTQKKQTASNAWEYFSTNPHPLLLRLLVSYKHKDSSSRYVVRIPPSYPHFLSTIVDRCVLVVIAVYERLL